MEIFITISKLNCALCLVFVVLFCFFLPNFIIVIARQITKQLLDDKHGIMFFPRVIGMYVISGTAFVIYAFKVPERWFPGKVDYIGHSHQWWHVLVLGALYYWHNSGMMYVQYRMNHGCANTMRIF